MNTVKIELISGPISVAYTVIIPDEHGVFGYGIDEEVRDIEVEVSDSSATFVLTVPPAKMFTQFWTKNPGNCKVYDENGNVMAHFTFLRADISGRSVILQGLNQH